MSEVVLIKVSLKCVNDVSYTSNHVTLIMQKILTFTKEY